MLSNDGYNSWNLTELHSRHWPSASTEPVLKDTAVHPAHLLSGAQLLYCPLVLSWSLEDSFNLPAHGRASEGQISPNCHLV